ncbi:hypothetical protein M8J77_009392 [Diaphorina citri]|nr:hypothetical protein M8J77_009392 [Diaphorina citri]
MYGSFTYLTDGGLVLVYKVWLSLCFAVLLKTFLISSPSPKTIIPANSYHSHHHKTAVFRNYYNRLLSTPLNHEDYNDEYRTIREIGRNNGFTDFEMRKVFNSTVKHKLNQTLYTKTSPPSVRYVKLPYIRSLENRLKPTLMKYNCIPAFSSPTLRSLFSRKDIIPPDSTLR